ncbi:hypothetical protein OBG91_15515 [Lactococcus lactis]|nr:hypothetical protein [Lactococcus lactis]
MSKEQLIQLKYRQTITISITLLVIAAILLVMSILGVEINELASGYNTTLSWLVWVSLLLLLIGLANYYLGVKLNETLDQKYPLTKGIKLKEKRTFRKLLAIFFNLLVDDFPIFGFITWFISFFNSL